MTIREELMMSMALRAGEMDALDHIDLDLTVEGEEELLKFIEQSIESYLNAEHDPYECDEDGDDCFDLWIEEKLEERFGK